MPLSTFSFTAPVVTEEQEQAEREAFSEKELQDIERDLYGSDDDDDPVVEDEAMIRKGLELLQQSLAEIPDQEKAVYLEALQRAPELVERESPGVAFLRCENYNAWAAARRMIEYWKLRHRLFGPERAFLPMTLDGAMRSDALHLQTALILPLPPDKHGRKVTFVDRILAEKAIVHRDSVCRCAFYMLQAISETETAQKHGFVSITSVKDFDLYTNLDRKHWRQTIALVQVMPLPYRAGHLCALPGKGVVRRIALPILKHLLGKRLRHRVILHSGGDDELVYQLSLYGIKAENIPTAIGGGYKSDNFYAWLKERQVIERQRAEKEKREENGDS